ncbi:VOC family protein [Caballeronia sp. LZ062]|uniref:VOC family protein n=1 Tax=unclassified Caballeronia TaxID=2646786 RepID=UPI00285A700E|nr:MULTISPECIES: VOC family protein [unclassified Caballeronia]MDR5855241.1 VOC family protein [Caballeronia sp. LZ050]MDR5870230.1 VOC family protein [Caballeronia sp. LZ062]
MHLRSVELEMPDRATAVEFLKSPWGMTEVGTRGDTTYLRGTAGQHYSVAIIERPARALRSATIVGTRDEIETVYERAGKAGLRRGPWIEEFHEPGHGAGFYVAGLEGEPFRFVAEAEPAPAALSNERANPIRIAHVVFNTRDRAAASRTLTEVFGFKLSDSTRFMDFLRCDDLHHVIAYADSKQPTLNHIAFEMKDTDAVLRGMGRLKDAGCGTVWGPGRHGPGDNVFAYFVGPFGACIEYTAEIMRVDDDYVTGTPDTWQFPNGRNDQWGIFSRDVEAMAASGDTFPYASVAA